MRSIPAIARLDYLDVVLSTLTSRARATVDDVRTAIGQFIEELALRGEARQTRDWRHPLAYRDTAVECIRELMRWDLVESVPLADSAESFDRIRGLQIRLTAEGTQVAGLKITERREIFGQRILTNYPAFFELLRILETCDLLVPELSDAEIRENFRDPLLAAEEQDGWAGVASMVVSTLKLNSAPANFRPAPTPSDSKLAEEIGRYLLRRFRTRIPKNVKEVTGTVNKAIAQAVLRAAGFSGDWNAYDRSLRWGHDLYLCNDARYVLGIPGWVAWSASKVHRDGYSFRIERRGVTQFRQVVRKALVRAYERIAEAHRSPGVQVPLIPIYEVRETAAFDARVCNEVVDRVLGEMVLEHSDSSLVVQLHLADLKDFAPSARPFRLGERRYFYVSMHHREQLSEGE